MAWSWDHLFRSTNFLSKDGLGKHVASWTSNGSPFSIQSYTKDTKQTKPLDVFVMSLCWTNGTKCSTWNATCVHESVNLYESPLVLLLGDKNIAWYPEWHCSSTRFKIIQCCLRDEVHNWVVLLVATGQTGSSAHHKHLKHTRTQVILHRNCSWLRTKSFLFKCLYQLLLGVRTYLTGMQAEEDVSICIRRC